MASEFGLVHIEGKQMIPGQSSGTEYEIDAKGVAEDGDIFFVGECRRHTSSKQKQEHIAALAYRIHDSGAAGGIIVSPLGLQSGAAKIAAAENIYSVQISPESTQTDYLVRFLDKVKAGVSDTVTMEEGVVVVKKNVKTGEIERLES